MKPKYPLFCAAAGAPHGFHTAQKQTPRTSFGAFALPAADTGPFHTAGRERHCMTDARCSAIVRYQAMP
jgi:hypothetical protein